MMRSIWVAFVNGGWAMWVILALGVAAVSVAVQFARSGERSLLGTLRWLLLGVMASGCFGFCIDLQAVTRYAVRLDNTSGGQGSLVEARGRLLIEGLNESLNTLSSAFLFGLVTAVIVAIGHQRSLAPSSSSTAARFSPMG